MTTDHHPLNYDSLAKSQYIDQVRCETIFGFRRADRPDAFAFALMGLCSSIENERRDLVAICRNYGIAILSDVEALEYLKRGMKQIVAKLRRIGRRGARIDDGQLSAGQAKTKEFYLLATAATRQAAASNLKEAERQEKYLLELVKPKEIAG